MFSYYRMHRYTDCEDNCTSPLHICHIIIHRCHIIIHRCHIIIHRYTDCEDDCSSPRGDVGRSRRYTDLEEDERVRLLKSPTHMSHHHTHMSHHRRYTDLEEDERVRVHESDSGGQKKCVLLL